MKNRTDTLLLIATTLFVAGLAIVAGAISFAHMRELASHHDQLGWKSYAFPASVDGLELTSSLYILARHRAERRVGILPWAALLVGTAASLAANVAVGGQDMVGKALAGWPAVSLLVAIKLLFSMFDHRKDDARTVRDGQRTVRDRPPVPGTGRDDTRPSGTNGGPRTDRTGPSPTDRAPAPSIPGARPEPGTARGGAASQARDVADLIPAARATAAALAVNGRQLSRAALADRMRNDGHGLSNARASLLLKILKAEAAVAPIAAARSTPDGDDPGESSEAAA